MIDRAICWTTAKSCGRSAVDLELDAAEIPPEMSRTWMLCGIMRINLRRSCWMWSVIASAQKHHVPRTEHLSIQAAGTRASSSGPCAQSTPGRGLGSTGDLKTLLVSAGGEVQQYGQAVLFPHPGEGHHLGSRPVARAR